MKRKTVAVSPETHETLRKASYEQNRPICKVLETALVKAYGTDPKATEDESGQNTATGDA